MISGISGTGVYQALQSPQTGQQQLKDDLFQKIDSDSSSGIDKVEFSDFAKLMSEQAGMTIDVEDAFTNYDQDDDGTLSSSELDSFRQASAPPPPPPGGGTGPESEISETEQLLSELFASLDSNSDNSIDQDEFSTLLEQLSPSSTSSVGTNSSTTSSSSDIEELFAAFDEDEDGSLNDTELESLLQALAPPPAPPMQQAVAAYSRQEQAADA